MPWRPFRRVWGHYRAHPQDHVAVEAPISAEDRACLPSSPIAAVLKQFHGLRVGGADSTGQPLGCLREYLARALDPRDPCWVEQTLSSHTDRQRDCGPRPPGAAHPQVVIATAKLAFPGQHASASRAAADPVQREIAHCYRLTCRQPQRPPQAPPSSPTGSAEPLAHRGPAPASAPSPCRGRLPGSHLQRGPGHGYATQASVRSWSASPTAQAC